MRWATCQEHAFFVLSVVCHKGKTGQFPFSLVVVVGGWKTFISRGVNFFLLFLFYIVLSVLTVYLLPGTAYVRGIIIFVWVAFFGDVYDRYVRMDHGVGNALCPVCFVRLCLVEREGGRCMNIMHLDQWLLADRLDQITLLPSCYLLCTYGWPACTYVVLLFVNCAK